jgi:DNA-directed RNA polymerase subunit RPC12/RpoP
MPTRDGSTIAKCADCGRVYASYYFEGTLNTSAGDSCPNCGGRKLVDVGETET